MKVKTSDLIKYLQQSLAENGDCDVKYYCTKHNQMEGLCLKYDTELGYLWVTGNGWEE